MQRTRDVQGVAVPAFMYGTAWKEEKTEQLVRLAISAGFSGIDTANQRKHYFEAAVGDALQGVKRESIFLQTKFTYRRGQDQRLPYDPNAAITQQVQQSFASSCDHLRTDYVDSFVLHGPSRNVGLDAADRETWAAMEALQRAGKTRLIGVSNISASQLLELYALATVKPAIVQNRTYASDAWDQDVRAVCERHGMLYQGFSLLTANTEVVRHATVRALAATHGKTPQQIVFRYALSLGIIMLTGTSSPGHMHEDLGVFDFDLTTEECAAIAGVR